MPEPSGSLQAVRIPRLPQLLLPKSATGPTSSDGGWPTAPRRQPRLGSAARSEPVDALPPAVVEAVERVRLNLNKSESSNHEANTIQFLIIPMLRGLGWEDDDPQQVIREFKPAGKQRLRTSLAVDIALLVSGVPKVFLKLSAWTASLPRITVNSSPSMLLI